MEQKVPLITVITVVYNDVKSIEKTILSVINQDYPHIEYIVIDGGSNDGTVDIIKKYNDKISFWISEPDKGIYDAMNKGLKHASGVWCIFMNAGDYLIKIPEDLTLESNMKYTALSYAVQENNNVIEYPRYDWTICMHNTLPHQGLFYNLRRTKIKFDIKYKIYSDYNLNIKFWKRKEAIQLSTNIVAYHSMNGISNNQKYASEVYQVVKDNFGFWGVIPVFIYFKYAGLKKRFFKMN